MTKWPSAPVLGWCCLQDSWRSLHHWAKTLARLCCWCYLEQASLLHSTWNKRCLCSSVNKHQVNQVSVCNLFSPAIHHRSIQSLRLRLHEFRQESEAAEVAKIAEVALVCHLFHVILFLLRKQPKHGLGARQGYIWEDGCSDLRLKTGRADLRVYLQESIVKWSVFCLFHYLSTSTFVLAKPRWYQN